jgi:tRNA-(ms[2]io[6]A)-hydroxylase
MGIVFMLQQFPILLCPTPESWLKTALSEVDRLLLDHAHCERKAASTAMMLTYRYPEHPELVAQMSRLAREKLRHFEQVLKIIIKRNIKYRHLSSARYDSGLIKHARTHEPAKLIDTLIIGAFVEARSCERFAALVPQLDVELAKFYSGLLASEARHYQHYINFAQQYADEDITNRIQFFGEIECELISSPDSQFRFHSGAPISS